MESILNFNSVIFYGKKTRKEIKDSKILQKIHDSLKTLATKIKPDSDYVLLNDICRELSFLSNTYAVDLLNLLEAFKLFVPGYQVKSRLEIALKPLIGADEKTILAAFMNACITEIRRGPQMLLNKFRALSQYEKESKKSYTTRVLTLYSKLVALSVEISNEDLCQALTNVICPIHKANIEMQIHMFTAASYANKLISLGILENKSASEESKQKTTCNLCHVPSCKGAQFCRHRKLITCHKCGKKGHKSYECNQNIALSVMKKSGPSSHKFKNNFKHFVSNRNVSSFVPNKGNSNNYNSNNSNKNLKEITCYYCKKQGHFASLCPVKRSVVKAKAAIVQNNPDELSDENISNSNGLFDQFDASSSS